MHDVSALLSAGNARRLADQHHLKLKTWLHLVAR